MVDLFLFREPETEEEKEEAKYIEPALGEDASEFLQTVPAQVVSNWDGTGDATWSGDWNDQAAAAGAPPGAAAPGAPGSWDQTVGAGQTWDQ